MLKSLKSYDDLVAMRTLCEEKLKLDKVKVYICMTGCRALGAEEVYGEFKRQLDEQNLKDKVEIIETGCQGLCARAPVITIDPPGVFYGRVTVDIVPEIISSTVINGQVINKLCYAEAGKRIPYLKDIPFYSKQKKVVLRNCGIIDPNNIGQYIARKGYESIAKALFNFTPEDIINEVKDSGLRGRGGAGFPTGTKWEFCRRAKGDTKYIICNADEGDPGAFMDRAVLEGDPHAVIEGMLVAARDHLCPDHRHRDRHPFGRDPGRGGRHRHRALRARHVWFALDAGGRGGGGARRHADPRKGAKDRRPHAGGRRGRRGSRGRHARDAHRDDA